MFINYVYTFRSNDLTESEINTKELHGLFAALRTKDEALYAEFNEKIMGVVFESADSIRFFWFNGLGQDFNDVGGVSEKLKEAIGAYYTDRSIEHVAPRFNNAES